MVPLSLDPVCPCHLWILTALLVDSTEARDLTHSSLLTMFYFALDVIACTKNFSVLLVLPSLKKVLPSTTSYYKACKNYFPVLLCTSLYYKTCTKYFPVLLCTTKLAQTLSRTTSYCKACTKYCPVLLCVLQSLHNLLPSTTLFYKTCTKYFPILLLSSSIYFLLQDLHKILPSTPFLPIVLAPEVCTRKFLHTEAFTHRSFHTDREPFTQRSFYTEIAKPKTTEPILKHVLKEC